MTFVNQLRLSTALALLVALSSAQAADSNAPTATLLFTGVTSGQYASFILTNGTSAHIACAPEAIEYQTNNVWKKVLLLGKNQRLTRRWTAVPEELVAGEAKSFSIPPPFTNSNWRLVFTCVEQRPIVDTACDTVRRLRSANSVQGSSRQFSGHHYSIASTVVTNQPAASTR